MLTVAICTWNRADQLDRCLRSLAEAAQPRSTSYEVVVVNNNCTDHTDAVIARYAGTLPVRRISEPTPGLSHARNAAIRETRGDWVLWTDDDVVVHRDWLITYERAVREHPGASIFAGAVVPVFEGKPPRWLRDHWTRIGVVFCHCPPAPALRAVTEDNLPLGSNYAIRTSVLRNGTYDTALGRTQGGPLLHGEETALLKRAVREGATGFWVPGSRVDHMIPPERQTLRYVYRYFVGLGHTDALLSGDPPRGKTFGGIPGWVLGLIVVEHARCAASLVTFKAGDWLYHLRRAAYWVGLARHARRNSVRTPG